MMFTLHRSARNWIIYNLNIQMLKLIDKFCTKHSCLSVGWIPTTLEEAREYKEELAATPKSTNKFIVAIGNLVTA